MSWSIPARVAKDDVAKADNKDEASDKFHDM